MKKYILSTILAFSFLLSGTAFASGFFSLTSPQPSGTSILLSCDNNDAIQMTDNNGNVLNSQFGCNQNFSYGGPSTITFIDYVFADVVGNPATMTPSEFALDPSYVATYTFHWNTPPAVSGWTGFLGGTAPSVGTPLDGNAFKTGLTASVGDSMQSFGPIGAVVAGIFLAFVIGYKMVAIWGHTAQPADDGKKLVRKSMGVYIRE